MLPPCHNAVIPLTCHVTAVFQNLILTLLFHIIHYFPPNASNFAPPVLTFDVSFSTGHHEPGRFILLQIRFALWPSLADLERLVCLHSFSDVALLVFAESDRFCKSSCFCSNKMECTFHFVLSISWFSS